jgi:hypothetical protein
MDELGVLTQTHQCDELFLGLFVAIQGMGLQVRKEITTMSIFKCAKYGKFGAGKLGVAPALIALSISGMSSIAKAQDDQRSGVVAPIEGTWIFTIYRVNQGITFSAFQSFTAGGVTLATGTLDRTPPPPISPLYGSWKQTGYNKYAAVICFFIFDDAGNALGMIKNPETFEIVDGDKLKGSGTSFSCDINGDNCSAVTGMNITITGSRLNAQGALN